MFVIPVNPALSIDSEQSSYKIRKQPAFGMQLTRETQLFLERAAELATANPKSRFKQQLTRLMEVIEQATSSGRENDGLKLEINNPLWDGVEAFTLDAQVKLENLGRIVEGKTQSLKRTITNLGDTLEGETIIDVALSLLADKKGKALHPIRLQNVIMNAQEGLNKGVERIRVAAAPLKERILRALSNDPTQEAWPA